MLLKWNVANCWDAMNEYTQGIMSMTDRVFVKDEKQRDQIANFRIGTYMNWATNINETYAKECVAMALNFYGCPRDWYKTPRAVGLVTSRLPERMSLDFDEVGNAGSIALCSAVQELYDAIVKDLNEVEITLK